MRHDASFSSSAVRVLEEQYKEDHDPFGGRLHSCAQSDRLVHSQMMIAGTSMRTRQSRNTTSTMLHIPNDEDQFHFMQDTKEYTVSS